MENSSPRSLPLEGLSFGLTNSAFLELVGLSGIKTMEWVLKSKGAYLMSVKCQKYLVRTLSCLQSLYKIVNLLVR